MPLSAGPIGTVSPLHHRAMATLRARALAGSALAGAPGRRGLDGMDNG